MPALLLGRFQPPHRGHLHAIRHAARRTDRLYVGVGSTQHSHERDHPFTVGERFELLQRALAEARIPNAYLFPVPDLHHHSAWVKHVESLVPPFDLVVTHNPLTKRLFAAAGYRVVPAALWRPDVCRGRAVRERWARGLDDGGLLTPAVRSHAERLGGPARVRRIVAES